MTTGGQTKQCVGPVVLLLETYGQGDWGQSVHSVLVFGLEIQFSFLAIFDLTFLSQHFCQGKCVTLGPSSACRI